jgi:hypothetical protein
VITVQKVFAVSEDEFIGYSTTFEVEMMEAGLREAAQRSAPSLWRQIHLSRVLNSIATNSSIVYYYRFPGHQRQLRRACGQRRIPVWGSIPNEVQILLAA